MPNASGITIMDGGMGRQLLRMGAPFRLPEWSALALIEAPRFVSDAHEAFIAAGAQVITTNSYALAPSRIGDDRFAAEGRHLADLSGRLARESADRAGTRVLVAGSLPPVFETYRPDLFDADRAPAIIDVLVSGLAPHIDLWLIETQSSTAEAEVAIAAARRQSNLPIWVSYTLRDEAGWQGPAQLRSGETVERGVALSMRHGAQSILFNCSQPEVMNAAVVAAVDAVAAAAATGVDAMARVNEAPRIGVYANAFAPESGEVEPYAGISEIRQDVNPGRYLHWAQQWVRSGATIIGGCCGIGPEHIASLCAHWL